MAQSNHQRVSVLMETLHSLVSQGHAQPRLVCEILLKYLDIRNITVWMLSLELVRNLVGGVHYKGCRDLMKQLFGIFDRLPRNVPEQQTAALLKGQQVSPWPWHLIRMCCMCPSLCSCCDTFWTGTALSYQPTLLMMRYLCVSVLGGMLIFLILKICRHYPDKSTSAHWVSVLLVRGRVCVVMCSLAPCRFCRR